MRRRSHSLLLRHERQMLLNLLLLRIGRELEPRHDVKRLLLEFIGDDFTTEAKRIANIALHLLDHALQAHRPKLRLQVLRRGGLARHRGAAHDVGDANDLVNDLLRGVPGLGERL